MKIYYYAHTGHRFGLDRFRTAVSVIKSLPDLDITLLTSDYRIASYANSFGIRNSVGIDVIRNIPNIAEHGDILFYDSDEHTGQQLLDMIDFFSKFVRISLDENDFPRQGEFLINPYLKDSENVFSYLPVETSYFGKFEKKIDTLLFFGDDDYDRDLIHYLRKFQKIRPDLLLGFYYFLGYEEGLREFANRMFENEEYESVIKSSRNIITSSYQTALQSLVSGGKPIYIERTDRDSRPNRLLSGLGIPVLDEWNEDKILKKLNSPIEYSNYENRNRKLAKALLEFLGV